MAVSKAASAHVKAFGNRMIADHGKANAELTQMAIIKGLDVPTVVGAENQKTADELSKQYGTDFDKAYMRAMVEDHEKDVKEFEKTSKNAKDAEIRNWATKMLPTLREHLRLAKDTQMKVK